MAKGECLCGAVKYEIDAELSDVYFCHCSICRRSTGAGGIAVIVVPNDAFRWIQGEDQIAMWAKPNSQWETWFCKVCGSKVPGQNDPKRMFVPAGNITEGGGALRVAHHIYVGSKAVWDEVCGTGKQHVEQFRG
jgi:hypothetical protein